MLGLTSCSGSVWELDVEGVIVAEDWLEALSMGRADKPGLLDSCSGRSRDVFVDLTCCLWALYGFVRFCGEGGWGRRRNEGKKLLFFCDVLGRRDEIIILSVMGWEDVRVGARADISLL